MPPADLPYHRRRRSTLRLLFSTDYSEFVTTRLAKAGYRVAIGVTALTVFMWVWVALSLPSWLGWGIPASILFFAPFMGLLWLAALRIVLEYLLVMFGISDAVHDLDRKVEYLATVTYQDRNTSTTDTPGSTETSTSERKEDAA